jgi:putative peptidoglycan lipid II flippase
MTKENTAWSAFLVGAGIFLSRIVGLIRDRVFAHYFGNSDAADAFRAAFRIPNFLQNLFGEGVLSASFIPVYAGLLANGDPRLARRVAGAIFSILVLAISLIVAAGITLAPDFVALIAPGFPDEKRALTVTLVQILFPGAGILALSAWCLGVLNSHRRFFLSYAAPIVWNMAIIAALIGFGGHQDANTLVETVAWATVLGSLLQFGIQLPVVLWLLRGIRISLPLRLSEVRMVFRNFVPVFLGRGVVQISAYIDTVIASLLPAGAVAALSYAQTLYLLPVSLFGMSVSAAELPAMAGIQGTPETLSQALRQRMRTGLRRIAVFVVPSAVAFMAFGDVIAAAIYQTGRFSHADALYVWSVLAGSAIGLLAATWGRLYASAFYALKDTRTPFRIALIRVMVAIAFGALAALKGPGWFGVDSKWGIAGLTAASGAAAWVEYLLLRHRLRRSIGPIDLAMGFRIKLWSAAIISASAGWLVKITVGAMLPISTAIFVLGAYGISYVLIAFLCGIDEIRGAFVRIFRKWQK